MNYFNQYSVILISAFILYFAAILLFRDGASFMDATVLAFLAGVFGLSWILIRPGLRTLSDATFVEAELASGQPTLLEFVSEY